MSSDMTEGWARLIGMGQAGQLQNFFTPIFTTNTARVATGSVALKVISTSPMAIVKAEAIAVYEACVGRRCGRKGKCAVSYLLLC
jgi:hypothetical protein